MAAKIYSPSSRFSFCVCSRHGWIFIVLLFLAFYSKCLFSNLLVEYSCVSPQLYAVAQKLSLELDNFSEFVECLNDQGFLLKRGGRKYQMAI